MESGLIQIVDRAMAEAVRKAGAWVVCRPGCFECCIGPFAISTADAERLREGLAKLESGDAVRAQRIRARATAWTGADDEACPALDTETGTCDLYEARPLTCRTFGPPVRCASGALAICELCFDGATEEEIAASIADLDAEVLDAAMSEDTSVAEALRQL